MSLTVTVWQKKKGLHPTRAAEERMESPTPETFDAAVVRLLASVGAEATPFQIVASVGCSSRALQLGQGWSVDRIRSELWTSYQSLVGVNG